MQMPEDMTDEELAERARASMSEAEPLICELRRRGYNVWADVDCTMLGIETLSEGPRQVWTCKATLKITREISI